MKQREKVFPFLSSHITQTNKGARPHERSHVCESGKHQGGKVCGSHNERGKVTDAREEIGDKQGIRSPPCNPVVDLCEMLWAGTNENGKFVDGRSPRNSPKCVTHAYPASASEKRTQPSGLKL